MFPYLTHELNHYYQTRRALENELVNYEHCRKKARSRLKFENQTTVYKKYKNDYETPLTMMHIGTLRQKDAKDCKAVKQHIKFLQRRLRLWETLIYQKIDNFHSKLQDNN